LIIRPSALGDVCRSVPVLVSLRRAFPEAQIEWLVQDDFAPAIEHHPALSGVLPFPRRTVDLRRLWRPAAQRTLIEFLTRLTNGYQLVVDCQGLGRSGFFTWVTRAERRIGYANAQEAAAIAYTEKHHIPRELHAVDRMLRLLEDSGITPIHDMRLYTGESERTKACALLGRFAEPGMRVAVVAPTSRWPGKRWPAERYAALITALLASGRLDAVAIVGAASEVDQCGPVIDLAGKDPRILNLIGRTPIGVLMAVIERAVLVIANDSAAVHMAVGFDRPLLGLYGPTRLDLAGPYRREADVIQAVDPGPKNRHKDDAAGRLAMEAITTERVIHAALERLPR